MTNIPTYRQSLAIKKSKREADEKLKRKYRILLVNLPFVIGEDVRFPDEVSTMTYIENLYFEEFGIKKTYAQIKQWL